MLFNVESFSNSMFLFMIPNIFLAEFVRKNDFCGLYSASEYPNLKNRISIYNKNS